MLGSKPRLPVWPRVRGLAMVTRTRRPQMSRPSAPRHASYASSFLLNTTKAKQGTLRAIQISVTGPYFPNVSSMSRLEALLSRSATWSRSPSMSGLGDLVRVLRLGDLDLDDRLGLDLDLEDLLGLDLLLDLGLPVLDLVLALESGEPDCDLVLALPEPDFERPLTDGDPEVPGTEAEGG